MLESPAYQYNSTPDHMKYNNLKNDCYFGQQFSDAFEIKKKTVKMSLEIEDKADLLLYGNVQPKSDQ